jgi:hypothetical protein
LQGAAARPTGALLLDHDESDDQTNANATERGANSKLNSDQDKRPWPRAVRHTAWQNHPSNAKRPPKWRPQVILTFTGTFFTKPRFVTTRLMKEGALQPYFISLATLPQ